MRISRGGDGNDTLIYRGRGKAVIRGGGDDDFIEVTGGTDHVLEGGAGEDTITGSPGNDTIRGGPGNDILIGHNGMDTLDGGAGVDTLSGGGGDDALEGGAGNDRLEGGIGGDTLRGGPGNDTYLFENGFGGDTLSDGSGRETLDFENLTVPLVIAAGSTTATIKTPGDAHTVASEASIGTYILGTADDEIVVTGYPEHTVCVQDSGGNDTYKFSLTEAATGITKFDVADLTRGYQIIDDQGSFDEVIVEQKSAAHPLYLNPDQVTNGKERIDFNGIERVTVTGLGAVFTGWHAAALDASIDNYGGAVSIGTTATSGPADSGDADLRVIAATIDFAADLRAEHIVLDTGQDLVVNRDLTAARSFLIRSPAGAVSTAGSATIIAPLLEVEARHGIDLNTHVDEVIAGTLANGDILIDERDDLVLVDVAVADGTVDVTSGGTLTAGNVASLKDLAGNDVRLTAVRDVLIDFVKVGLFHGWVIASAGGDVRELDPEDTAVDIIGWNASLAAGGNVLPAVSTDIEMKLIESADPVNDWVKSLTGPEAILNRAVVGSVFIVAEGTITVTNLTSGAGEIYLVSLNGDILVDFMDVDLMNTGAGEITLTAENGAILEVEASDGDVDIKGGSAVLTAGHGIGDKTGVDRTLETSIEHLQAYTGAGSIRIAETDAITLADISAAEEIEIAGGGYLETIPDSLVSGHSIHLTATSITVDAGVLHGLASIDLIASVDRVSGTGGERIETALLEVEAQTGITLTTRVDALLARIIASGNIRIAEADDLELREVIAADGSIEVMAGGEITAGVVTVSTDAAGNDIDLKALAGDIRVGVLTVGKSFGRVFLEAPQGYISDTDAPGADHVDVVGASGRLRSLPAIARPADGSLILEFDLAVVKFVTAELILDLTVDVEVNLEVEGIVDLSTTGTITVTYLTAGSGSINLTSGDDILVDYLDAGSGGTLTLTAGGSVMEVAGFDSDVDLIGKTAVLKAAGGIGDAAQPDRDLESALETLQARASAGPIRMADTDDFELLVLEAEAGDIRVRAGGSVTVTGNLIAGGEMILEAVNDVVTGAGITLAAQKLSVVAGTAIDLNTQVEAATRLQLLGAGDLRIEDDFGAINLDSDGYLEATVTAGEVVAKANAAMILNVSPIISGNPFDVVLDAAGYIKADVRADELQARAGGALTLTGAVAVLDAATSAAGDLEVTEADDITLRHISCFDGSITIDAGGAVGAVRIDSLTDGATNGIGLNAAGGDLKVTQLVAGPFSHVTLEAAGDLSATTTAVSLSAAVLGDARLTSAGTLNATVAATSLFVRTGGAMALTTTVARLDAATTAPGAMTIDETDDIELINLQTANGPIAVTAEGNITAVYLISLTGDITLESSDDILVAGTVTAANRVAMIAGERDPDHNFLYTTDNDGKVRGTITISALSRVEAQGAMGSASQAPMVLAAANEVVVDAELDEELGSVHTTIGVDVDQTGWYDTITETEYETGDPLTPYLAPYAGNPALAGEFGVAIGRVTQTDFSHISPAAWNELVYRGYISDLGEILLRYTGPGSGFTQELIPFDADDINEITSILNAHTTNGAVIQDDFDTADLDDALVWQELLARGYIDADGEILPKFSGLTDEFQNELIPFDTGDINEIAAVLNSHTTDRKVTQNDFDTVGPEAAAVWDALLAESYINPVGEILPRFTGLTAEFENALARFTAGEIEKISEILHNHLPLTADDFSERALDGDQVLAELSRRGYIDPNGLILPAYPGPTPAFHAALRPLEEAAVEEISEILHSHLPLAADDFAGTGLDAERVLEDLRQRGYIDAGGGILPAYPGPTPAFHSALGPLDQAAVQQISAILDARLPPLKKLFEVNYQGGTGRIHTVRLQKELAIIKHTPDLMNLILTGEIAPSIPPSPYPGYVYIDRAEFEAYRDKLEEFEYVPAWSTSQAWEIIHAADFLGSEYESLPLDRRPDFYIKIQLGGGQDIERSIFSGEDASTYENIGDTRLSTEVIFHQIGWWWTGWEAGTSPDDYVKEAIEEGLTWNQSWTPAGKEFESLRLRDFMDLRNQLDDTDDPRSNNFQTGVKQPAGEEHEWVPWYVYEYVAGERQVVLADGRVGAYTDEFDDRDADDNGIPDWVYDQRPSVDDPDGQLNRNFETHLIDGAYVLIPVATDDGAYHDLDGPASAKTGDRYGYNWSTGEYVFEAKLAVDYDDDNITATKLIPVNYARQTDLAEIKDTAREYLGDYRDYGSYFWDKWRESDNYSEFKEGKWYSQIDIYGSGSTDKSYECVDHEVRWYWIFWPFTKGADTRYQFRRHSAVKKHEGSSRDYSNTWDQVAWQRRDEIPDNTSDQHWDQVAVDYHWQYRGHVADNGKIEVVKVPTDSYGLRTDDPYKNQYKDFWRERLQWTNGKRSDGAVIYSDAMPADVSSQNGGVRPNSDYHRVDEFEDRRHYAYQLNYNHHGIRDLREHMSYRTVSVARPVYGSPSVIAAGLEVAAGARIRLDTDATEIEAAVSGFGDVQIKAADTVTLNRVTTGGGNIFVRTRNGDLLIGLVDAGAAGGNIFLRAGNGSIREADSYDPDADLVGNYGFYNALAFGSDNPDLNLEADLTRLIALQDDAYVINKDKVLTVPGPGLLANDSTLLTVTDIDTSDTVGQVTFTADGGFIYDPAGRFDDLEPGETAVDSFAYQVSFDGVTMEGGVVAVTVAEGILLEGTIHDGPIAGATVTAQIYDRAAGQWIVVAGPVDSDYNGEFSLVIRPEELHPDAILKIEAVKIVTDTITGQQEVIRLISYLPTVAELELLAGIAGSLSTDQVPELIVSNITSVVLTLMDANQDGTVDSAEAAAFTDFLEHQEVTVKKTIRDIATAVKVVIDDPAVTLGAVVALFRTGMPGLPLPDSEDILELVSGVLASIQSNYYQQVLILANNMLTLFRVAFPGQFLAAEQAMREDLVLIEQLGLWANNLPDVRDGIAAALEDHPVVGKFVAVDPEGNPLPLTIRDGGAAALEGYPVAGAYVAVDPDGDPLTLALVEEPDHGTLRIHDSGLFIYTPEPNFHGTDDFTVAVSDGIGTDSKSTIAITVAPVNDPPDLASIADQTVTEGRELTVFAVARDPDLPHDNLVFSLEGEVPLGAFIDPLTGAFRWTPAEMQGPWTYTPTVRVTDAGLAGSVLSDTVMFTITVLEDETMDTGPLGYNSLPDTYQLQVNGDRIEARLNGTLVFATPLAGAPPLIITGSSDDDTLIIDLNNGNPIPAGGLVFNGGGPGDSDTLTVRGGLAAAVAHTFTGADSGSLSLDGSIITYTGLEPIVDEIDAVDRVFTFADADDVILIDEGATNGDNYSLISSVGSSESVEFRNPLGSLTIITGGGNDTVTVTQFDPGAGGAAANFNVMVNGQSGDLRIGSLNAGPEREVSLTSGGRILGTGPIVASDLTVTAGGDVDLHTTIETLAAGLVGPGNVSIRETGGITLRSVETTAGSIMVDAGGPINSARITAGFGSAVTLTAAGPVTAAVSADTLVVRSAGDLTLNTAVGHLAAEATVPGNIFITESNDIGLDSIRTVDGLITVKAGGRIESGQITAGSERDVSLQTDDSVSATVIAGNLSVQALGDMTLATTVATLYAETTAAGDISIFETDTIGISGLRTANGSIRVTAGGTIVAALAESLADSDANDITLIATSGDIRGDTIHAGLQGDVTLNAAETMTATVIADELSVTAAGPITLVTSVNVLRAASSGSGDLTVTETDGIVINSDVTALTLATASVGDVRIVEVNDLILVSVEVFNGSLTVDADSLTITDLVSASEITLRSRASISMTVPGLLAAGKLEAYSVSGMVLRTDAADIAAEVSGPGSIEIKEFNAVVLSDISTQNGAITIVAGAAITAHKLESDTDSENNDIILTTASGDIEAGVVNAGEAGDVILTAGGAIIDMAGKITADELTSTAAGAMVLDTTVAGLTAATDGALTVTESDGVILRSNVASLTLTTGTAGDVEVVEADDLILLGIDVAKGTLTVDADNLNISGMVSASEITLKAEGSISMTASAVLAAGKLEAYSVSGMVLLTDVDDIKAEVSGPGNIAIEEADAVVLSHLSTEDGWINVAAGGDITADLIHCIIDADANDITLTTTGSHIQATEIDAGSLGDVFLTSTGPLTATVTADELSAAAAGDMTLHSTVASLHSETTAGGDITIDETDDIFLNSVRAFDGSINVAAGGTITVRNVESLADAAGNDISLTATSGDVLIDFIAVGPAYGGITVQAAGNIHEYNVAPDPDDGIDVRGHHAYMDAGEAFCSTTDPELNLEMDLTIFGFYGDKFIFDFVGDIELNVFASGTVRVTATGTITARNVESGAGDIELNAAGGDIVIGYLDAGADDGTVRLTAAGSIYEDPEDDAIDLVASTAYLTAGVSVGGPGAGQDLETDVDTLFAEVTGSTIYLNEVDDIELVAVDAPDGEIVIKAGGDIFISGPVGTGETAGHIRLEAAKELYMTGNDPATTHLLEAIAQSGIFLHTRAALLDARVENAGNIEIHESDAVTLRNVTNADGPIHVISGGTMTATHVESQADADGNNVGLMTLSGDILVDHVGVESEHSQVSLTSAGHILEVDHTDPEMDLHGAMGILCAKGKIDGGMDRSFKRINKWSSKTALYQFDRGRELHLHGLKGNVELFVNLENRVNVSATGNIHIAHLNSNGHDITLRSKSGDINVARLETGPDPGDIELKAEGSVHLAGELYSGSFGRITAGDDIEIYADGDVIIFGRISAGSDSAEPTSRREWYHKSSPDVAIDSDAEVFIHGEIFARDDVEIWSDEGVLVDAPVSAGGDIEIGTGGALVTTEHGPVTAGGDLALYAKQHLSIDAELTAGVDVEIETRYGTIELRGTVQSGDGHSRSPDVQINSGEKLYIYATINSLDDVEIWADDDVFIDAPVTAVDDIEIGTGSALTTTAFAPLSAGDDIELYADGTIRIDAEIKAGADIRIDSWDGDVLIAGGIAAGGWITVDADENLVIDSDMSTGFDLNLHADQALTTTLDAKLAAGVDVAIETRYGDMELWGAIHSGNGQTHSPDVLIDSGGRLDIHAKITSLDDVSIRAEDGILITDAIIAQDQIEIRTCGDLTTTASAPLSAGGSIELYAKKEIVIHAAMAAVDNVKIDSRDSDVLINGVVTAGGWIDVDADGDLVISAAMTAGADIGIKSRDSDVLVAGTLAAGGDIDVCSDGDLVIAATMDAGGDLDLYARHFLTTTDESTTLTAGVDVEIETRYGTIELRGAVHSGNGHSRSSDVLIDSGAELLVHAAINSLDDVKIWADDGVFIDGPVTAVDNMEIGTYGELTTTAFAPLSAGNDIEIYAGSALSLGAEVTAGGDIRIDSWDGDVIIAGSMVAGASIDIDADENLIIRNALQAGGDLDLYSRYDLTTTDVSATLTAGTNVELGTRCGNIVFGGAVSAGNGLNASSSKHGKCHRESPDIMIDSGAELYIQAAIDSTDDVRIKTDDGIFIDASITAADDIKIESGGNLMTAAGALLTAGDDIELKAKGLLSIGAALLAGDDVRLYSRTDVRITGALHAQDGVEIRSGGNIVVAGAIEAFDRIDLSARHDLTLLAGSILSGINGEKARRVYLRAGDTMILYGTIHARILIICN